MSAATGREARIHPRHPRGSHSYTWGAFTLPNHSNVHVFGLCKDTEPITATRAGPEWDSNLRPYLHILEILVQMFWSWLWRRNTRQRSENMPKEMKAGRASGWSARFLRAAVSYVGSKVEMRGKRIKRVHNSGPFWWRVCKPLQ